jgi:hypothetical protein
MKPGIGNLMKVGAWVDFQPVAEAVFGVAEDIPSVRDQKDSVFEFAVGYVHCGALMD